MKPNPPHGLHLDLPRFAALSALAAQRRRVLRLLGGLGLGVGGAGLPLLALAADGPCSRLPAETAGPFPADGSNRSRAGVANVLGLADVVRSDIRSSIGGLSGTAAGVPLTLTLTLVNSSAGCAALAGHAVYLWHNDQAGRYSMYSSGATEQNYLRGVQVSDATGRVSFQTIFPGCYAGRWPHLHFEVFRSLAAASRGTNSVLTSQLALPLATCQQVYASPGYASSPGRLAALSLAGDFVFADDSAALQLASVSGSVAAGQLAATLVVGMH